MNETVTILVDGFIGDILFASSVAKRLKMERDCYVEYVIRHVEPYELLTFEPAILKVHYSPGEWKGDVTFRIGEVDQSECATTQFQRQCGVQYTKSEYEVWTNPAYLKLAEDYTDSLRDAFHKPVIAYQVNWKERTFGFTKEEYERGIDTPPLGYGARRRDVDKILNKLSEHYTLLPVGLPDGVPNGTFGIFGAATYSMTASIIRSCDWMIGGEGGLTNLAAGVGTKTIITGDFILQLYGWNGCIKKIAEPKMGPQSYFPEGPHRTLDPFLTDDEVAEKIMEIIG